MTPLRSDIESRWPTVQTAEARELVLEAPSNVVADLCRFVVERGCRLATIVVEQRDASEARFDMAYVFLDCSGQRLVWVVVRGVRDEVPSVAKAVHAADWNEREIEDLFGIRFPGHPVLGDFVLHDATWREDVAPMRRTYDLAAAPDPGGRRETWRPRTLLKQAGAHALPIGPVYGDTAESVMFVLESTGEVIQRCVARPFYKYRAVEKLAEGRAPADVVLLAERFSGDAAFAHALAFCQALESLAGTDVPPRGVALRVVFAELERARSHIAAVASICASTAFAVARAQSEVVVEDLLRLTAEVAGHRYLYGVCAPGGLSVDLAPEAQSLLAARLPQVLTYLSALEHGLRFSSSFLDRLEDVGVLTAALARDYGVVGPVGRASGTGGDLRVMLPYASYSNLEIEVASESEGDGYARLRILLTEARVALRLCLAVVERLPQGETLAPCTPEAGAAVGAVEAPAGAAFHWVRIGRDGHVERHHIEPPSLRNLHALAPAVEGAAFQDFPIILSTFDLSLAESDR